MCVEKAQLKQYCEVGYFLNIYILFYWYILDISAKNSKVCRQHTTELLLDGVKLTVKG